MWWLAACTRVLDLGTPEVGGDSAPTSVDSTPTASSCVPGSAPGFELPSPRWGLAALHAERQLDGVDDPVLASLDADYVLALAWELSAFGCADYGVPWTLDSSLPDGGCLQISDPVVWGELCKLYPDIYDCQAWPDPVNGDTAEAQVMSWAWFAVAGRALLGRYEGSDTFFPSDTLPVRAQHAVAVMHVRTPWFSFDQAFADCPGPLTDCVDADLQRLLDGVDAKVEALASAECFDAALTDDDIRAYVGGLAALWPGEDWPAVEAAALAAPRTGRFADDAPAVVDAIDAAVVRQLACPEATLFDVYRLPCP